MHANVDAAIAVLAHGLPHRRQVLVQRPGCCLIVVLPELVISRCGGSNDQGGTGSSGTPKQRSAIYVRHREGLLLITPPFAP
jgi:hypothetical protein